MTTNEPSIRERWESVKPSKKVTFWIAIAAIVLTMVYGFTRGGWVTESTSRHDADLAAQSAVVDRLVPICLAQFELDPQSAEKLVEMKAENSTVKRAAFVTTQGWALMPGETAADPEIASACARQLDALGN